MPHERRNEICKLAVLSTYKEGSVSFKSLGCIEREHRLPWSYACKQLWVQTRMLPFALCTFSFRYAAEYVSFVSTVSAAQRDVVRILRLELECEDREVRWRTELGDKLDEEYENDFDDLIGDEVDIHLKLAFPNLQNVTIEVFCWGMRNVGIPIIKRWITGLKERGCTPQDQD